MQHALDVFSIEGVPGWLVLVITIVLVGLGWYFWRSREPDQYDSRDSYRSRSRNPTHEDPQSSTEKLRRKLRELEDNVASLRRELAGVRSSVSQSERAIPDHLRALDARLRDIEFRLQARPAAELYAAVDRSPPLRNVQSSSRPPEALGREPEYQFSGATRSPVPELREVYYAPIPEDDGSFMLSDLTAERKYNSLYSLQVTSPGRATVSLSPNPDVFKTALGAPQKYLAPACNYRSSSGANPTEIKVVSTGTAVLDSQRWRIQTKLEIELI
jgi:hypothetical protein